MRPNLILILILILALICIMLTGCGQPQSRAAFKASHPWSQEMDLGNGRFAYPDKIPEITPGGAYSREDGMHVLTVTADGDTVVAYRWIVSEPLSP